MAAVHLCLLRLSAAPLTWFPGPAMDYPGSYAATVVLSGLGNAVIAGSTAYPEALNATNIYWTPLGQPFYSVNIAPGAVASGGAIIVYGGNDGSQFREHGDQLQSRRRFVHAGFHERAAVLPRLRARPQRQRLRHRRLGRRRQSARVRRGLQPGRRGPGPHRQPAGGPIQFSGGV